MRYYSTERGSPKVGFKKALMNGLAPDGGLYMPEEISKREVGGVTFPERAIQALSGFTPKRGLEKICHDAFNFRVPLRKLDENLFVLELFHGPTLSFKDFGARFMSRAMTGGSKGGQKLNIVVATSGDTGSAVAAGFYGVPGVEVFVLYPKGRVTDLQEKQMTTLGGNVHAIEVAGNFDDCQRLAKEILGDKRLGLAVSSANSINIGRLLPQMTYYFEAAEKLRWKYGRKEKPIIVVPSGNFGNLTAGLFAKKMGLPVELFVAAVNVNSAVPGYLATGNLHARDTSPTLSNAMDVGNPSNWRRIVDHFEGNQAAINNALKAITVTDRETEAAIFSTHDKFGYIVDPHTAVGLHAASEIAKRGFSRTPIIALSTAHPAKFRETVERVTGLTLEIPERLAMVMNKTQYKTSVSPSKAKIVEIIKSRQ
ncbi:MAG: threonine synthase [Parcubacteria group bacterium Gr01-1014_19]|nr:MAG: threonine synthase [Parcubacteria group bacterium Gr01-1014_19]